MYWKVNGRLHWGGLRMRIGLKHVAIQEQWPLEQGFRMIQRKILHRAYYTRTRLYKMGRAMDDRCLRGCGMQGSLRHTILDCPALGPFWKEVVELISEMVEMHLPWTPQLALLGIWGEQVVPRDQLLFCNIALIVAKRDIIQLWGTVTIPRVADWCRNMDWCMRAEESVYKARGCPRKFDKVWGPMERKGWAHVIN